MKILAIDTSCDDTSIAIVEVEKKKIKIRSNIVSSQVKLHQKYGGVYPALAKREHQKNLPPVLKRALKQAGLNQKGSAVDAIAVTIGPGLEPCLWTGINFAKDLAQEWNLPIIPVNHIEAHILANFLNNQSLLINNKIFPAVCLIVSGGHTQLILMNPVRGSKGNKKAQRKQTSNGVKKIGQYKIIGETRDDAAGECFDKTARILGLPYPGGPAIAEEAARQLSSKESRRLPILIILPRPMLHSKDYDFSFSGLKTAVLYDYKKRPKKVRESKEYIKAMAKEIQQAIIDVLIKKTSKAGRDFRAKSIILGGGVAANEELRKQFTYNLQLTTYNLNFLVPPKNLCTDNAAMVAVAAYFHRQETQPPEKVKANANLRL